MNLRHRARARRSRRACPPAASSSPPAALQALEIVDLALEDDGGAVSAYEIEQPAGRAGAARAGRAARAGGRLLARGVAAGLSAAARGAIASARDDATDEPPETLLITLTGKDRPGVTSAIFATLAAAGVEVLDIEQIVLRRRLDPRRAGHRPARLEAAARRRRGDRAPRSA